MNRSGTEMVETVYTENEWCKYMKRNGKRIFLRWIRREAKNWCKLLVVIAAIMMFISIAGYMADMIVR